MPPRKHGKNVAASGSEGIDALPDGVLEHILGFLPATEAVRTCVLARRWCHIWKSATGLRITCGVDPGKDLASLKKFQGIVDSLLHLRGCAPLETFELVFCNFYGKEDVVRLNRWVQHAVMLQVRMLKIKNPLRGTGSLDSQPLVSRHLTSLEMVGLEVQSDFSDFSRCPSLKHLDLVDCYFWTAEKITSESLKRLSIRNCVLGSAVGTLVCVPNLVSLRLDGHFHRAPVFQSMPSLQEAFVGITHQDGVDKDYDSDCCEEDCYTCYGISLYDESSKCWLLEYLSEVENMALISGPKTFILNMDLKQCPTFSKLKSLLLNDCWCVAPAFHALDSILKHSPVLQKLSLQLYSKGPNHKLSMKGRRNTTELSSAISGHLKIVEVKCEVADERVFKILKFLGTLGISFSLDEVEISE